MKNKKWEIIRLLCGMMIAMIAGAMGMGKFIGSRFVGKSTMSNKYLELFLMMNQWVKVKQSNKNLSDYFERVGLCQLADRIIVMQYGQICELGTNHVLM